MADEIAIGIDLGTSYSCVSILENGQPTVIPNEWGERTHASVVSFLEDGTVLVGNSAKRNIITNADNTVYSAKRLIGRFGYTLLEYNLTDEGACAFCGECIPGVWGRRVDVRVAGLEGFMRRMPQAVR